MLKGKLPLRHESAEGSSQSTAPSHLSCVQCRNRKLKCDRRWPACDRCLKQSEPCVYPGSRQRAIGRRKTVRELEERIEQLEELLSAASLDARQETEPGQIDENLEETLPPLSFQGPEFFGIDPLLLTEQNASFDTVLSSEPEFAGVPQQSTSQVIDLGLFEQLPSFDLIDELTTLYFKNVHAGAPLLHQTRYMAALRLPPHMRQPMCLLYIVMASGAATADAYRHLAEPFFKRARVYAEADELKGQGETFMTLAHAQSWCLISGYECHVHAHFTRASTSLCRSVRIAQMLKLHQLDIGDAEPLHWGPPLPPAMSLAEAEERRRTWWIVFLADRYLTATTGWPSLIDERHIRTNLPSSEESFAAGTEETAIPLSKGLLELEEGRGDRLSPLAYRILAANKLLHALDHTSPLLSDDGALGDIQNGLYWKRQRAIDKDLGMLTLFLPEKLQLSRNPRNLDAILVHMSTNMAVIQIHRTASALMQQYSMPSYLISQSQARLLPAAENILSIFHTAGDSIGAAIRNPLLSFAAYMAASVFLDDFQAAGSNGQSQQSENNLNFLIRMFIFFGSTSQLVRTVAFQLAADVKQTGFDPSMMDKIMNQVQTLGGSTFEIIKPNSTRSPMLFCPALTFISDFPLNEGLAE